MEVKWLLYERMGEYLSDLRT